MTSLTRRGFLGGAAALLAAARLRAVTDLPRADATPLPADPFTLGVASGDPAADGVVLWTRLAPDPLNGGGMGAGDELVAWQVATDAAFTDVVASGVEPAVAALGHSVHVDVPGLDPDTWYHYRFSAGGYTSPVGRARTFPPPGARTPLRLGAASCQNWRSGYYTAHAALATEGCDLVAFLGDYIYESAGSGPVRDHGPVEPMTLVEYRNRYALYKGDPNLQAAHAACPWIVIWDDHEVENNYAGDMPQVPADQPTFLARRAAAYQVWFEHQPVRLPAPGGPDYTIYRHLDWGGLARIHLLDTRQYRSDQACGDGPKVPCLGYDDPARTLVGPTQAAWLNAGLDSSTAVWDVVAQQIVFGPMPIGTAYNMDQWDGYPADRQRVWDRLQQQPNPVVLSGDIHFGASLRLHQTLADAATPRRGTELVVGSISSTFGTLSPDVAKTYLEGIPWWDHVNAADRGYTIIDLTETTMHAELRVVSTALATTATVRTDHVTDVTAVPVLPPTTTTTSTTPATTSTTTATTAAPTTTGSTGVGSTAAAAPVAASPAYTG